jgi:hypothetical protein
MGREYDRNEFGGKNKTQVKINGSLVNRQFRNEGEARTWLKAEGYTKEDLKKGTVKIIHN